MQARAAAIAWTGMYVPAKAVLGKNAPEAPPPHRRRPGAARSCRQLAVSNLRACGDAARLLPDIVELDLSKNRLTSLARYCPCGIRTLILAQNQFETLPEFLPGKL